MDYNYENFEDLDEDLRIKISGVLTNDPYILKIEKQEFLYTRNFDINPYWNEVRKNWTRKSKDLQIVEKKRSKKEMQSNAYYHCKSDILSKNNIMENDTVPLIDIFNVLNKIWDEEEE
jgi:hypothetical protein